MNAEIPKQFLSLHEGISILQYTTEQFFRAFPADFTPIIVLPEEFMALGKSLFANHPKVNQIIWAPGGSTRFQSVQHGLQHIQAPGLVFIHDAVRPCITVDFLHRLRSEAHQSGNVIPCVEVKDSLRVLRGQGSESVDRSVYRAVQTPQVFQSDLILKAYAQTDSKHFTDDASVAEAAGIDIRLTAGMEENIKITRPADLELARILLKGHD